MARLPQQVHIYLYRQNVNGEYEFSIFQREDFRLCWQGVCGGVEEGETIEKGVRRELYEEAEIDADLPLYRLDTLSYLPANIFTAATMWGKNVVVVPMYFFAMPFEGDIIISDEHTEVRWLSYEEAEKLVFYHDQKTALWELKERLLRGNLIR